MKINMYRFLAQIALLVCVFQSCGDPGYHMRPVGWEDTSKNEWRKQFGDFEIRTRGITGLIGDSRIDPNLQVYNNAKSILVEAADLVTATEKFSGEVYSATPIPAGDSGYHFPIQWKFADKQPTAKVLGDHFSIMLKLKIAGEPREIKIEYVRD